MRITNRPVGALMQNEVNSICPASFSLASDYTLTTGSTAVVDAGLPQSEMPVDLAGWYRDSSPEIGAFEEPLTDTPSEVCTYTDGRLATRTMGVKTLSYTYDAAGRLQTFADSSDSGNDVTNTYDHLGRRIAMEIGGVEKYRFVYDGEDVIAEYFDSNNDADVTDPDDYKRVYWILPEIDQRVGFLHIQNGTTNFYAYLTDQVGSVLQIVDSSGTVINQYDYDAFGNIRPANSFEGIPNRYTFQGREWDSHAGHYYFRNRTYIPEWGCFTGPDMNLANGILGEPNGIGNYLAFNNNGLRFMDPLGLGIIDATLSSEEMLKQIETDKEVAALIGDTGLQVLGTSEFWARYATAVSSTEYELCEYGFVFKEQTIFTKDEIGKLLFQGKQLYPREKVDEILINRYKNAVDNPRLNSIRRNINKYKASLAKGGLSIKERSTMQSMLRIAEKKLSGYEQNVFNDVMKCQIPLAPNTTVRVPYVPEAQGYAHVHPPKSDIKVQNGGDMPKLETFEQLHYQKYGDEITAYGFVTRPTSEGIAEIFVFQKDKPALATGVFLKYPRIKAKLPTFATIEDMQEILNGGNNDADYTSKY